MSDYDEFEKKLSDLINYHSLEGDSGTPDFILAKYLVGCLHTYNEAVRSREAQGYASTTPEGSDDE